MKKTKKSTSYLLPTLALLLLGVAIQLGLGLAQNHRDKAQAAWILSQLSESAESAAQDELQRREQLRRGSEQNSAALAQRRLEEAARVDESLLILVNRDHPLPEDYNPGVETVWARDGRAYSLDRRCAADFLDMMADCAAAGGRPYICSGYRSREEQEKLYAEKIRSLIEEGLSPEEAPKEAALTVAVPGTGEHELGLAADLMDESYPYLDEEQENTATQRWLMENSWRYGFILRYPNGTTHITGILYEPWHYRYVGRGPAEEIHRMGITLEEYLLAREGR